MTKEQINELSNHKKFLEGSKYHILDMLNGNVNRMCATYDYNELTTMAVWAHKRIDELFDNEWMRLGTKEILENEDNTR